MYGEWSWMALACSRFLSESTGTRICAAQINFHQIIADGWNGIYYVVLYILQMITMVLDGLTCRLLILFASPAIDGILSSTKCWLTFPTWMQKMWIWIMDSTHITKIIFIYIYAVGISYYWQFGNLAPICKTIGRILLPRWDLIDDTK